MPNSLVTTRCVSSIKPTIGGVELDGDIILEQGDGISIVDAGSNVIRLSATGSFDPSNYSRAFDEFMASDEGSDVGDLAWNFSGDMDVSGEASHPGIFETFVSSSGAVTSLDLGIGSTVLSPNNVFYYKTLVRVPLLSTSTQEFTFRWGLQNSVSGSGAPTNGVYFSYVRTASVQWQCHTTNASTTTTTASGITVVAGDWVRLEIVATPAQCQFYINGTVVATHVLNIPTAGVGPVYKLAKTAGFTRRDVDLDYYQHLLTILNR